MAESKGFFGVLPYAFASLRSLTTDFQTVHRTVFIGEADRPCSNPLLSYQQKTKGTANAIPFIFWRRARDFFGVLPYAFASLRSLTTDFQTVHRTVFIGEADRPCSNPLLSYQQKTKGTANAIPFIFWRRARDFFGVLPYAFASLRSLTTDFQTVHRTVFIGEADRPCSNPLLSYQQKTKGTANAIPFIFWRRARDSNPRNRFGGLHDFQSCSFDQLGQLSVSPVILYTIV